MQNSRQAKFEDYIHFMARNNNSFKSFGDNLDQSQTSDISFIRENFGERDTRNSLRGRSFNYAGQWSGNVHYRNDSYIVDFVSFAGTLWVCTRSHLSSFDDKSLVPNFDNSQYWQPVLSGEEGQTYLPEIRDGKIYFKLVDSPVGVEEGIDIIYKPIGLENDQLIFECGNSTIRLDANNLKWELKSVEIKKINSTEIPSAELVESGKENKLILSLPEILPEFKTEVLEDGSVNLLGRVQTSDPNSQEWQLISQVGYTGEAIELTRITRDNEDILVWKYKDWPINQAIKLCSIDELKGDAGDQNIYIGCDEPEDKSQIWYDPCEDSTGEWNAKDFLYEAYLEIGGELSQEDFEKKFKNLAFVGSSMKFVDKLPDPTEECIGYIYIVSDQESTQEDNQYNEYVVVNTGNEYKWELFGSTKQLINLENYYTKSEVDKKLDEKVDNLWLEYN